MKSTEIKLEHIENYDEYEEMGVDDLSEFLQEINGDDGIDYDIDVITTKTPLNILSESDKVKQAYANILEFITNSFYRQSNNKEITVEIDKTNVGNNYYDGNRIVLSSQLMDAFGDLNLPRFLIYYHELGHHLYTQGIFKLMKRWETITSGPLTYDKKYMHLLNWIEDFYIEDQLKKDHSYLTDVIDCIKKLQPEYDVTRIEYAFNYWYLYQAATPALVYTDQLAFMSYIKKLLKLRNSNPINFGLGILTTVSIKRSKETEFVLLLIDFYNWCVAKGIFPPDQVLESLDHPTNYLTTDEGDKDGDGNTGSSSDNQGSYTSHTGKVGKIVGKKQRTHIGNPTNIFKDEIASENKMVYRELINMYERLQSQTKTLAGLFSTLHEPSPIIQPKVIIPNFFNPNRLIDQVLFLEKQHTYTNVAIFRDVSGSTSRDDLFKLMHLVCERLMMEIPVDIDYYLYSSGDISILKVPYVPWESYYEEPDIYRADPLFKQLGGGTNSDAIADVITEQFSDKWLNIVITDGDLYSLMRRDNIHALLSNVFVIAVDCDVEPGLKGISVKSPYEIPRIIDELANMKTA